MGTHSSRGFTLVEMMIVIVIAGVVTLGLVGFYLNSQATWMDASAQALAQRDATSILDAIASKAREAAVVEINPSGGDTILTFRTIDPPDAYSFWWNRTRGTRDSLIHQGPDTGQNDAGPVAPSVVERFYFEKDPALPVLHVHMLEVRSLEGERVQVSTSFKLYNVVQP
jgi:prepilin-type N-terminal cleavage/methylation domain-containing protein